MNDKKIKLLKNNDIIDILNVLSKTYPNAECGLEFNSDLELVIALILAAQCTDKRVNQIRPILFKKYPDVYTLAAANQKDVEDIIHSCGFYNNKSKNIIACCKSIVDNFNGKVPNTMNDLTSLAGIGRKSANIILQECFDISEGIAVDTHVKRITGRLGFTKNNDPVTIEQDLLKKVPKDLWNKVNHILVCHGRAICDAKKPKCSECPVNSKCLYFKK